MVISAPPQVVVNAVDKTSGALNPLPNFSQFTIAPQLNDAGSLSISYPSNGVNFSLPHGSLMGGAAQEVEVWLTGQRPAHQIRGYLTEASGDELTEGATWGFGGTLAGSRLDQAVVFPQSGPAQLVFTGQTPGYIVSQALGQAQLRGTLSDWTGDFSNTTDSSGLSWPTPITLSFDPGTTLLQILQKLVSYGLVDFRVYSSGGIKVLQLYANAQLGVDHTVGTSPIVFQRGKNLSDAPIKISVKDVGSTLLMTGGSGTYAYADDAAAASRLGYRVERAASASNVTTTGDLNAITTAQLATIKNGEFQVTCGITQNPGDPIPGVDFDLGDWVYRDVGTGLQRLRVTAWSMAVDENGSTATVTLVNLITSQVARLKRQLELINSGAFVI